ncbi:MAG: PD-(D/E)XK nuclease family protein [Candidatus Paceibacterota bacterium]|jgi:CRISPR/Cas system-associated exonuclease Cas4 (RecB family)|nr:PD-(D/E)XK nuclease family protein [Candidatus Paceibacterota bacterium]
MLREVIDKYYLDNQKDREQHHFYVTDAGKCGRAVFFKFKNAPRKEMQANILRLFDHGDHVHQLIMKPLLSMREVHVVASEVNIPPQEIISGRSDAIISDGRDLYVLDIKSMNSMIFDRLKEPKPENIDQLQLYLYYFRVPRGILLYVNKNTLELKEFVIDRDENRALSLVRSLEEVKKDIDANLIPDRLQDYPSNWQCRYCQFRSLCGKAGPGKVSWESFKEKIAGQKV